MFYIRLGTDFKIIFWGGGCLRYGVEGAKARQNNATVVYTKINASKSQPSSSVQPTTKRNWVNLSDRVRLSFKEKNDIQNDKKICCNIIDFAQQLLKQQFPSVKILENGHIHFR